MDPQIKLSLQMVGIFIAAFLSIAVLLFFGGVIAADAKPYKTVRLECNTGYLFAYVVGGGGRQIVLIQVYERGQGGRGRPQPAMCRRK